MDRRFITQRVNCLLEVYLKHLSDRLPIDLYELAPLCGVLAIEEREMIPEAVIHTDGTGFRISLQSNFIGLHNCRLRRRFSLAHEIAHTFFYEVRDGRLKPIRRAPVGDRLEAACHEAASLLLIPEQ